jgi:transcriptional regulator with XRE-family HTH domain
MAKKKKKIPKILVSFADNLRKRRYALSLTQEELAERANFHVNYIGGLERGQRNPSLTSLELLAKGLDCSIKDLLPDD